MLEQLDLTPSSQHLKLLNLTTVYNIVNGTVYFPTGFFVLSHFPYSSNSVFNYTRPFAHTNYLLSSFVQSVVLCGIAYQTMLKFLLSLFLRLMYHISMIAIQPFVHL